MFYIRSDVITLGSIEMYGLVTIWTSMDDGPYWVILLMYGSHDMRHTGFRRLTVVNRTPGFWGVTNSIGRIFSGFNGATTTTLGDITLPIQARPVTQQVLFSVVDDLGPYNFIVGKA